ncbi:unnamed protein product [Absidia cylindrospora]
MYIYAGKDEQGNTVSDLFMVNLNTPPYIPHTILDGSQSNSQMVLLKSQHFCEAVCGKLLVFGRYINNSNNTTYNSNGLVHGACGIGGTTYNSNANNSRINTTSATTTTPSTAAAITTSTQNTTPESMYGLWMLDLDTLEWERQECNSSFDIGGWNYFTVITENIRPNGATSNDEQSQVALNSLFFLGNTELFRPQGHDHFRDALVINGESLGLYDIPPLKSSNEFGQLLNNSELSDFVIVASCGQELHVHQVILITRWPHFRNMYKSGMIETQQHRMEISEPYPVVLAFLKYLYSDHLAMDESWQVICEILVMANMYLLHRLKKICCQRLYEKHLTIDTCTTIFEKAIMAEEMGLKLLALDFMFHRYGAILKADLLHQMSSFARQEFVECVPDDAVLQVGRSRNQGVRSVASACSRMDSRNSRLDSSTIAATPSLVANSRSSSTSTTTTSSSSSSSSPLDQQLSQHYHSTSLTNGSQSQPLSTSTSSFFFQQVTPSSPNYNNHIRSSMTNTAAQTNDMMTSSAPHQRLSSSNGMAVGV